MAIGPTFLGLTINEAELTDLSLLTAAEEEILESWSGGSQESLRDNPDLIRIGKTLDYYDPLAGKYRRLWSDFYNLAGDKKSALNFYKKYGPMRPFVASNDKPVNIESLGEFFQRQMMFRRTVTLYKHLHNSAMLKLLLKSDTIAQDYVSHGLGSLQDFAGHSIMLDITSNLESLSHTLRYDSKENRFSPRILYFTLHEAIYWQFRNVLISDRELVECRNPGCEAVFVPLHGNQIFHSSKCKQQFNDQKRSRGKPKIKKREEE